MTTNVKLRKLLHRKSFEMVTPNPAGNTAAGAFIVSDKLDLLRYSRAMYVGGVSAIWRYEGTEDGWLPLPNSGATGTFAAGACGEFRAISAPAGVTTLTATAGTTTTITTNLTINRNLKGTRIRAVAGPGAWYEGIIASNTLGTNSVLTLSVASGTAFTAATQFQIFGGSLWFMNAGTVAVGFSVYDVITNAWTARSVTGLPTAWGTDAQLVSTGSMGTGPNIRTAQVTSSTTTVITDSTGAFTTDQYKNYQLRILSGTGAGQVRAISANTANTITVYDAFTVAPDATSLYIIELGFSVGLASAGAASTLTDSTKAWQTNAWANYQIRIIRGTGAGQIRTIASNTSTVITTSAAWTTAPDTSSVYRIEGNDDYFYLLGNNAVTLYRYSISGNSWSTLTPTAARAGAPGAGLTGDWIDGVPDWIADDSPNHYLTTVKKQNGRYIYSFRGAGGNLLDIYDIAANTWISNILYGNQFETFTTGSCSVDLDGKVYIQKDATGRIYVFMVNDNELIPLAANLHPQGAAVTGDKMFILPYFDGPTEIQFLYTLLHTRAEMLRVLLF